ncbi:MAG: hypothetical protein WCJ30_03840 [Deltaproteobacteria bacterium]
MIARLAVTAAAAALVCASVAQADVPVTARGDRLVVLPPHRAVRAGAARFQLDAPVPARPFAEMRQSDPLQGYVSTPPLVLDDGSLVVGVSSPPGVVWVQADGHVRASTRLDERPAGELTSGSDGRVFVSNEGGRIVWVVAPDGTVRGTLPAEPTTTPVQGPIVRDDGSVVVVANGGTAGVVSFFSPSGERVASRSLSVRTSSGALGLDGCVWLLGSGGASCLDANGSLHDAPFGRGANAVVPISTGALALVLGTEVQIRTPAGELLGRTNLRAPALWVAPLPSGGVAALRTNPSPELVLLGADAAVVARIPLSAGVGVRFLGVLSDRDGALVGVTNIGVITAYDPDGTERWHVDTRLHFERAPVPLRGGGFVIALSQGGLLFVR